MKVRVEITRKAGIADPEGATVRRALAELGYDGVAGVRFGRVIDLELDTADADTATSQAVEMCERLLANPVIEDYSVAVIDEEPDAG